MRGVGAAAHDTFRSIRHRNLRLFLAGQLLSQMGTWMKQVALTLLVLNISGSGIAVGVLTACQFGPSLFGGLWAGVIVDRSDKRKLLLATQLLSMLQSLALGAVVLSGEPRLGWLYAFGLFGGIVTAFDNPTRRSFVCELVPEEDVQNAISLNSAIMTSARLVGPALAGLLISLVGYAWCFFADGVSYVFVLAGIVAMRSSELFRSPVAPRAKGQLQAGLRYVWDQPDLRIPLTMLVLIGTLGFNFTVVIPILVRDTFHSSEVTFTYLVSVQSVGSVVGALCAAHRRTVSIRRVVAEAWLLGVGLLFLAMSPTLAVGFIAAAFLGFASLVFLNSSMTIVQIFATPAMRGRVIGLQSMVLLGSAPIGGLISGTICDIGSPRIALGLGAAACAFGALWGSNANQRRTLPARQ